MEKSSHRAVIQYLLRKGLSPEDIHEDMVATLGADAPVFATVKKWATEFQLDATKPNGCIEQVGELHRYVLEMVYIWKDRFLTVQRCTFEHGKVARQPSLHVCCYIPIDTVVFWFC